MGLNRTAIERPVSVFVSPEVAAELLSLSRTAVYELIRIGELPSVRQGKRRLISRAGLEAWARERLVAAGFEGEPT